jgi:uncharacterized repeat protein (TIGR02543 family)
MKHITKKVALKSAIVVSLIGVGILSADVSQASSPKQATVTFYANNGHGENQKVTTAAGKKVTVLPSNTFSKRGYHFVGWTTKANGKGKLYKPGTKVKTLKSGKTVKLYQKWSANRYKVVLKNGSKKKTLKLRFDQKQPTGYIATSTKKTFVGYALEKNGPVVYKAGRSIKNVTDESNKKTTLYAVFKKRGKTNIEVNLKKQRVYVFDGKTQIGNFVICSGKKGHRTPTGHFKIQRRVDHELMQGADYYIPNVRYTSYFRSDGIALHAAPWRYKKGKWRLGRPRSHGCINMKTQDAKFIWKNCPKGTSVWVHNQWRGSDTK